MASSSSARHYEVFLSFRGEDTRKGFVSHLYDGLQRKGILTFKDDRELPLGGSLPYELPKAIDESKVAVVVISQTYASSRWCLKELQVIMEHHKEGTLTVIPIFYWVDPSHVRNLSDNFAVPMQKYEGEEEAEDIQKWRDALKEIGKLTGVDSRNCQDEATMVRNIVGDISKHLFRMSPEDTSDIFGMDAHFDGLAPLLNMGSEDKPRMIGIWGMGGVGKTTIAKCLYSKYKCQFSFHCFIENIKKFYDDHGREKLQQHFLSKILCDEGLKSDTYEVNSNTLKARLRGLKVLVIFDDVNKLDQLEALVKEADWFGPGSRIIITTRDKGILVSSDIGIYTANCLGEEAAVKLFNHFAFRKALSKDQVSNDFADLSVRASRLVQCLPLGLKVLGSFLCGREIDEWEDAINRLSGSPRGTVMESLRVSYGGLDEKNKRIFLTVAYLVAQLPRKCTWRLTSDSNGEPVNRLVQLLEGKEREIRSSLNMLAEKALIDISDDGSVTMHDLIKEMAEEIVYEQSPDDPGKRKFLWDAKEIYDVLEDGTGTDAIEGISLDISRMPDCPPSTNGALESMLNLKFLMIWVPQIFGLPYFTVDHGIDLSKIYGVFNHFPRKIKLLDWLGCPLTALPSSFKGECLVELCLPDSKLKKLSEGTLNLRNLKKMDLGGSSDLEEIPSLCGATKLEELYLSRVRFGSMLCCGHATSPFAEPSYWEYCPANGFLPSIMGLKSLKVLSLQGWLGLSEVPKSIHNFSALRELDLSGCEKLENIPDTIGGLTALETLNLSGCMSLSEFPSTISSLKNLYPPEDISCVLKILDGLTYGDFSFRSSEGGKIQGYFDRALGTQALEVLCIEREYYVDFFSPFQCKSLSISQHLRKLTLAGLNLPDIPEDLGDLQVLQSLDLSGNNFKILPASIKQLSLLEQLNLCFCPDIRSLPEFPLSLKHLFARRCSSLKSISNVVSHPFERLLLNGCYCLGEVSSLVIQHMIDSMPMHKRNVITWASFSARKVPDCFSHRSTEQKLAIPCAQTDSGFKPMGFVAGVVVASDSFSGVTVTVPSSADSFDDLSLLNINCFWHGGGDLFEGVRFDAGSVFPHPFSVEFSSGILFVFSCNFGEEKSCDGISFHFNLDFKTANPVGDCKIKGCGVQLCFAEELHQAQRQDIEEWVEHEKFSDLGSVHHPGHS